VLHLPDLEALTGVALGPPQPAARRRVDPPHVVEPAGDAETSARPSASRSITAGPAAVATNAAGRPSLVNLLKVPLDKLTAENIVQGSKKLGQIALWLQQPKMMLAAVAAVALQLAAVLAMLTGTGDKPVDDSGARPHLHGPHGAPIVDHRRPIQTPLNAPSQFSPMLPGFGPQRGPVSVAQPSPPQPLPGVRNEELPAWPGAEGPSLVTSPDGLPLSPPSGVAEPTLAPATSVRGGSTRATPVGATGGTVGVKPKLKGTILKVNEAAR